MLKRKDEPTHRPVGRFDWERLLERADIPHAVKLVGFLMALRGNPDGCNVKVSARRIADACDWSEKYVERQIETLRALGLVERLRVGSPGHASVYRLTQPALDAEPVPMRLDPDGVRLTAKAKGRGGRKPKTGTPVSEGGNSSSGVEAEDRNSSSGESASHPNSSSGVETAAEDTEKLQFPHTGTPVPQSPNSSSGNHVLPSSTNPVSGYYPTPTSAPARSEQNDSTQPPDPAAAYRAARPIVDRAPKADRDAALAEAAQQLAAIGVVDVRQRTIRAARLLERWAARDDIPTKEGS